MCAGIPQRSNIYASRIIVYTIHYTVYIHTYVYVGYQDIQTNENNSTGAIIIFIWTFNVLQFNIYDVLSKQTFYYDNKQFIIIITNNLLLS